MPLPKTGTPFDNAASNADSARQIAQVSASTQATARSADVAYYQALLTAANAAGLTAMAAEFTQTLATLRYAGT